MDTLMSECFELCATIVRRELDALNEEACTRLLDEAEHTDYWNRNNTDVTE